MYDEKVRETAVEADEEKDDEKSVAVPFCPFCPFCPCPFSLSRFPCCRARLTAVSLASRSSRNTDSGDNVTCFLRGWSCRRGLSLEVEDEEDAMSSLVVVVAVEEMGSFKFAQHDDR